MISWGFISSRSWKHVKTEQVGLKGRMNPISLGISCKSAPKLTGKKASSTSKHNDFDCWIFRSRRQLGKKFIQELCRQSIPLLRAIESNDSHTLNERGNVYELSKRSFSCGHGDEIADQSAVAKNLAR
jgi:hypothetical protein